MLNNVVLEFFQNGNALEKEYLSRITELVIHTELNCAGTFSVEFLSETLDSESWDFLTFEKFNLGDQIKVVINEVTLIVAEIYSIEPSFEKSTAKVTLRGYDLIQKLKLGQKNYVYSDVKDSDVIEVMADRYQINANVEKTKSKYENLIQFSLSDFQFLMERCELNGFVFYMNEEDFVVGKPDLSQRALCTLNFPTDILDGNIFMSVSSDSGSYFFKGWDESKKESFDSEIATANSSGLMGEEKNIFERYESNILKSESHYSHSEIKDTEGAAQYLEAKYLLKSLESVRGNLTIEGNINIQIAKNIEICGIGKFSGIYYVKELKHTYQSNKLETEISVLRTGI